MLENKFQPGHRVAVYVNQSKPNGYYYGVITNFSGSTAKVLLDRAGKTINVVKVGNIPAKGVISHIVPVEQWIDDPKGRTYEELAYSALPLSKIYLQKKSIPAFGLQTIRAMYTYCNHLGFLNKLPKNLPFKFLTKKFNVFGQVHHKWVGDHYDVLGFYISRQQHIIYKIFTTVAHECIHVYQYIEQKSRYPANFDIHGATFTIWIPFLKQRLGVEVTVNHVTDTTVSLETVERNNKVLSKYYVVLWEKNNYNFGFKTLDQAAVGAAMTHDMTIYQGNDARALVALKTTRLLKKSNIVGSSVSPTVAAYWKQHGKIFWSPDKPNRLDFNYYILIMYDYKISYNGAAIYVKSSSMEKLKIVAEENKSQLYVIYDVPKGFFGSQLEDVNADSTIYHTIIDLSFKTKIRKLGKIKFSFGDKLAISMV